MTSSSDQADPLAELVSAAVIGRAVKLSARRITQLRDEGRIPAGSAGRFVLGAATAAYCDYLRGMSGDGEKTDLATERALLARAQREGHSMRNARIRGEQLDVASVESVFGGLVDNTRSGFLRLPTRAAPLLIGVGSVSEISRILTNLVHDILAELSAAEFQVVDGELVRQSAAKPDMRADA